MARPVLQETKIILATPIVCRLPQWVLVLLQRITYGPRLCGLVRRIATRGARKNEGRREWVTGGRARMASSETGFARSYLKEPVCVFVLYLSMSFNIL